MPQFLEFALQAAVAPALVLTSHADDEGGDRPPQARPPHPFGRVGPLPRDQTTMPPQQRIWRNQRRDGIERPPAEALGLRRQSTALVVRQPELPAMQLLGVGA